MKTVFIKNNQARVLKACYFFATSSSLAINSLWELTSMITPHSNFSVTGQSSQSFEVECFAGKTIPDNNSGTPANAEGKISSMPKFSINTPTQPTKF